jgi:hypothetical protein
MDPRLRIVRAVERSRSIRRRAALRGPSAMTKLMQPVRAIGCGRCSAELQTELQRRCRVRAGLSTIHNAIRWIGLRHNTA